MNTSENGLSLIRRKEGLSLTAFWDVDGWSIGYGHHSGVKRGQRISKAKAEQLLRQDVKKYERALNGSRWIGWKLTQNQFDALVSFSYNLGCDKIKSLCAGRTAAQVANKMLLYNKAGGKTNKGLAQRRKEERTLFLSGTPKAAKPICPYVEPTGTVTSVDNARAQGCRAYIAKGEGVRWVQWQLVRHGSKIKVDGVCGPLTVAAIRDFQRAKGLTADGIAGAKTRKRLKED